MDIGTTVGNRKFEVLSYMAIHTSQIHGITFSRFTNEFHLHNDIQKWNLTFLSSLFLFAKKNLRGISPKLFSPFIVHGNVN